MEKCNNTKCTLRNECYLAQLKTTKSTTYKQVGGDCDKFIPKKSKDEK